MPQRSNNLDTLLMSLEMLKRIPRTRKVSAPELQMQLEAIGFKRDLRTVQRQLEALTKHFDIDCDVSSKPYSYSWKRMSEGLSLPGLNEQDSILLTLAEQHLRHLLPAHLMQSMEGFFLQAKLKLEDHGSAKKWQHKVRVISRGPRLLPPKISEQVFQAVSNALYADHWLDITYVNAGGKQSESRVMPLGLAQEGARLLLVCRFDRYEDERSLALHRIRRAQDTGFPFQRPAGFDLQRYDEEGRFGFSTGRRIKLVFRLPKLAGVHLTESPLSADQSFISTADGYEFTATVTESEHIKWWLRGFGRELKLLEPAGLLD